MKTQKTRNWKNRSGKFDWTFFLKSIAVIGVPVALQNLLSTTGSMIDTMMLAAIGEKAVKIADGAAQSGGTTVHFSTKEEAIHELKRQLEENTAMLVKASHAMHFEQLVKQLRETYD